MNIYKVNKTYSILKMIIILNIPLFGFSLGILIGYLFF